MFFEIFLGRLLKRIDNESSEGDLTTFRFAHGQYDMGLNEFGSYGPDHALAYEE
jgi:hypothetical protein